MSPGAARVFLPILRDVERQLGLPIPDRVRILRELEFDLEGLRERFLAQGLSSEEARTRALDALVPDRATLRDLDRLHAPFYRRITRPLSGDRLRLVERSALGLATALLLLAESLALVRTPLLRDPSPFLWPVLALGALLFATLLAKAFELWIKGDHRSPTRGLRKILVLAGLTLALGVGGTFFDLYHLASVLERAPDLAATLLPRWVVRDSALLAVSLLIALAGGLTWFVLTQWLTLVAGPHRAVLGLGNTVTPASETES